MPARTLPNIGLKGFYDVGENGWGAELSEGLLKLSVLVQGGVKSRVAAVPGAPAEGDVHILTAAPNANAVAVYDDGAWVYYQPNEGWLLYDRGADVYVTFDGAAWEELATAGEGGGGGLADAPADGKVYGRKDGEWVEAASGSGVGGGGGGGTVPAEIVQSASGRVKNNGGVAVNLAAPPTVGNLLLLLWTGSGGNVPAPPADFSPIGFSTATDNLYGTNLPGLGALYQGGWAAIKRVQPGDTGAYNLASGTDLNNYALLEITDADLFFFKPQKVQMTDADSFVVKRERPPFNGLHLAFLEVDNTAIATVAGLDPLYEYGVSDNHYAKLFVIPEDHGDLVGDFNMNPSYPVAFFISAAKYAGGSGSGSGGGDWAFNPPKAADVTVLAGDATVPTLTDDDDVGLIIDNGPNNTDGPYRGITVPIPADGKHQMTVRFNFTGQEGAYTAPAFGVLGDGDTRGRALWLYKNSNLNNTVRWRQGKAGQNSGNDGDMNYAWDLLQPTWIRVVVNDDDTVEWWRSSNGKTWIVMHANTGDTTGRPENFMVATRIANADGKHTYLVIDHLTVEAA